LWGRSAGTMPNHTGAHISETKEGACERVPHCLDIVGWDFSYDQSALWEKHLVFGQYSMGEVLLEVKNANWQGVRVSMLGTSHVAKWEKLRAYLESCNYNRHSRCVVTNYVYALKRGGVIR
jgi:hypothetical protein